MRRFVVILLLCPNHLSAQEAPDPLCVQAAKVPIPKTDLPATPTPDTCNPLDLYYTNTPQSLRQARACAFTDRDRKVTHDEGDDVTNLMANAVLAMIYAQGKGVAPNLPLAERFACEMNDWGNDGRSIAYDFEDARLKGARTAPFDICKEPLGRQSNFVCISRDAGIADDEVRRAQLRFNTGPPAYRDAFARLLAARKAYEDAREAEEPNGTTGTVQTAIADENEIQHTWAATLNHFAAGQLPRSSADDFSTADAALNTAYKAARAEAAKCDGNYCLTTTQLTKIERAWIIYRDAWVAYAALRWPTASADSFRAWLTRERTEDLKTLVP
jgi:uncharacterized protein YecT (DUF1311 family)